MNRIAGMVLAWMVACAAAAAGPGAATAPKMIASHPAADTLKRIFAEGAAPPPAGFRATGLSRRDYLALMAGNVDFFRQHQDERGAIVDPYEKKERQYSTPAFALAAALLIAEADRGDLLEPASRALSFSIAALANNTTADNHPDFYIPMVIHARRLLVSRVKAETAQAWERNLRGLVPESTYRDTVPRGNWNVVNVAGEMLRRKDGLVPDDRLAEHLKYIDRCLEAQRKRMTNFGMYEDPNAPLAYDAFPRLWLEDALADGAYDDGAHREHLLRIERWLTMGGLSTLLLLSPAGEWACGGRSAFHQWNEAEIAVISEINAARWKRWGRADVAGAFKRAAHLALESMRRWQRPSGELWIVKNRADPARRHGYEGYSFHSQYNLLAVAMLAIAYQRADDSIEERPVPSESASYVYDLRETFHKICAAAGGTYILIDTGADPHYNATGLQRIHKTGVAFSPLSDSAAAERSYGPGSARFTMAISPAMAWNDAGGRSGEWLSLSQFSAKAGRRSHAVRLTDLTIERQTGEAVEFQVRYLLEGPGARIVEEGYRVDASGVEVRSKIGGDAPPALARVTFPVLVSDGSAKTQVTLDGPGLTIRHRGGRLSWEILGTESAKVQVIAPDVACHVGLVRLAVAELPRGTQEARWRITLAAEAPAE